MHSWFWLGNLREGDHLDDQGVDGSMILKGILDKWFGRTCSGSICLRIGTGGGAFINVVMNREFRD